MGIGFRWLSVFSACYDHCVPISDTDPAAREVQIKVLRNMTGEQRLLLAIEMSEFAHELSRAGIRDQHPEWSEKEVTRELLRRAFYPAPLPDLP